MSFNFNNKLYLVLSRNEKVSSTVGLLAGIPTTDSKLDFVFFPEREGVWGWEREEKGWRCWRVRTEHPGTRGQINEAFISSSVS